MTGSLPLTAAAEVRPISSDLIAPQKAADHLCLVETAERTWVEQLEALARWHTREIEAILARTKTASMVPALRDAAFQVTVVLLSPSGLPSALPRSFRERRGRFRSILVPRYVRLWEIDPAPLIRLDRRGLLPWIALMRGDKALAEQVAVEVARRRDLDLAARFVTIASLRYDRGYLLGLLEKLDMLLYTKELVESTPVGQEILKRGIEEGREEAASKGRSNS